MPALRISYVPCSAAKSSALLLSLHSFSKKFCFKVSFHEFLHFQQKKTSKQTNKQNRLGLTCLAYKREHTIIAQVGILERACAYS